jgi:hypothetical protein
MCNEDFHRFPEVLNVGQSSPDGELIDAGDASVVRLSDYWSSGPLVIEFGSIT